MEYFRPGACIHYCDGIVVENGRHVFGRELVCRVRDKKTCFADRTVTDNDTPNDQVCVSKQYTRDRSSIKMWLRVERTHLMVATTMLDIRQAVQCC